MQHAYSPVHLSMQMIMAKKTLDLTEVMSLVDTLNMSPKSCKEFIAMLEAIFDNSPSERILLAVEVAHVIC